LEKLIKFTEFFIAEITQDWVMAGKGDRADPQAIMVQARAISEELIRDFPNVTLANLKLITRLIRKHGYEINWKSIAKVMESLEYQQHLKDQIEELKRKTLKIENNEKYPTLLEKSVLLYFMKDKLGSPNDYQGETFLDRKEAFEQAYRDNIEAIRAMAWDMVQKLKQAGWQDNHQYTGQA